MGWLSGVRIPDMDSSYTWLLFDADGTILDYRASEAMALKAAIETFGYKITEDIRQLYHRINSALWAQLEKGSISSAELRVRRFEELSSELGWDADASEFSDTYLRELARGGFMMDGARDMLEGLPADMNLAIITNGIRDVQYGRLKAAGIRDMFSAIIISEDAGVAKPASGYFDYALDCLNHREIKDMLVIGDSLSSDIAGGAGYGIDTCWYNPDGLKNTSDVQPLYEIADWNGLFRILRLPVPGKEF